MRSDSEVVTALYRLIYSRGWAISVGSEDTQEGITLADVCTSLSLPVSLHRPT
jgi:hypothetical protein